jgi:hypothetical protein
MLARVLNAMLARVLNAMLARVLNAMLAGVNVSLVPLPGHQTHIHELAGPAAASAGRGAAAIAGRARWRPGRRGVS